MSPTVINLINLNICLKLRVFRIFSLSFFLLFFSLSSLAAAENTPLKPDDAFRFSAKSIAADMVQVQWDISANYYLYKDKIRFVTNSTGVSFGPPIFPQPTEIKTDEFFGKVPVYRKLISIDIPVIRDNSQEAQEIEITATSQGCADFGICYPPHQQTAKLSLNAAPSNDSSTNLPQEGGLLGAISKLTGKIEKNLGFNKDSEFLNPDQAFVLSLDSFETGSVIARWHIADGYYLYQDKFSFAVKDPAGVTIGKVVMPPGKMKTDETFGRTEVYYKSVEIKLPIPSNKEDLSKKHLMLEIGYQGCADAGLCYPPIKKSMPVNLVSDKPSNLLTPLPGVNIAPTSPLTEQDQYLHSLVNDNLFFTMLSFFGVGLLLAFTPCMFPMIPILSSIIAGQGERITTRKAFLLSLFYVLAMAITYTTAGIIAAAAGNNLQALFQNPWILSSFSAVFVLLALSMFGFYNLQLPTSFQAKISNWSNSQEGGTLIGASVMGFLSALIVGPCLAAPLAGALLYIAQTGDTLVGGAALFAMSIGMGIPLIIIGTSAGKILPKAGGWMHTIKAVFGVLLLGVAIWMLERIIPASIALMLWAILLIVSAVFLGALDRLGPDANGWRKLWQGIGVVFLIYGGLLILGASNGGTDLFQPLRNTTFSANSNSAGTDKVVDKVLTFKRIKGLAELNQELMIAKSTNTPVMLDFYADWCVSCKEMEKLTFSDPKVQDALQGVILLQADVTANDDKDRELLQRFGIFGPPTILFFGSDGEERTNNRLIGFLKADKFYTHVLTTLGNIKNPDISQKTT